MWTSTSSQYSMRFMTWAIPVGAVRHIANAVKPDGTLMVVEPMAGDKLSGITSIRWAASFSCCFGQHLRTGLSGAGSGRSTWCASWSGEKLTEVLNSGGFSKVRRSTETLFNMVLEARL